MTKTNTRSHTGASAKAAGRKAAAPRDARSDARCPPAGPSVPFTDSCQGQLCGACEKLTPEELAGLSSALPWPGGSVPSTMISAGAARRTAKTLHMVAAMEEDPQSASLLAFLAFAVRAVDELDAPTLLDAMAVAIDTARDAMDTARDAMDTARDAMDRPIYATRPEPAFPVNSPKKAPAKRASATAQKTKKPTATARAKSRPEHLASPFVLDNPKKTAAKPASATA